MSKEQNEAKQTKRSFMICLTILLCALTVYLSDVAGTPVIAKVADITPSAQGQTEIVFISDGARYVMETDDQVVVSSFSVDAWAIPAVRHRDFRRTYLSFAHTDEVAVCVWSRV